MLPGEHVRDFVLTAEQHKAYLAAADEPLKSVASFLLETGLRLGEALALTWEDVHITPVGSATRGYVAIRCGKTRYARRNVSLTATAQGVLARQRLLSQSDLVFVREDGFTPVSRFTLSDQHERARTALSLPRDFVIHSLRHTMLTALGASGADSFTIMRIAGHSSITISQRYVHPTPESLERAFDRFEALQEPSPTAAKRPPSTTKSTTVAPTSPAQPLQVVAG